MIAFLKSTTKLCGNHTAGDLTDEGILRHNSKRTLKEAAFLGSCSRLRAFRLVIFHPAAPGIAASAIYAFVRAFNEYVIAQTLAGSKIVTYTVGLTTFADQYEGIDLTLVSAASFTALAPVIVMFGLFHKYFVIGLTRLGSERIMDHKPDKAHNEAQRR